jgi:hypothetical protein
MRESLKHVFSKEITLEDKSHFYYTTNPFELKNALGNTIAVLEEYHFTKKEEEHPFTCKLYKTKEGNWYDIDEVNVAEQKILRMLKSAIDIKENNNNVLENIR